MQGRLAAKNLGLPVGRVVVEKWPTASQFILEVRKPAATRPGVLVIFSSHGKANSVAGRYHDGGRPDLNVQLDNLPGS